MAKPITSSDFGLPSSDEPQEQMVPIRDLKDLKQSDINQMIHLWTSARLIQALETGGFAVTPQLLAQCLRYLSENKVTGKVPGSMAEANEALKKYNDRAPFKMTEAG